VVGISKGHSPGLNFELLQPERGKSRTSKRMDKSRILVLFMVSLLKGNGSSGREAW
jgi:hypothetical protein